MLHIKKPKEVCTWRGVDILTYLLTKSVKCAIMLYRIKMVYYFIVIRVDLSCARCGTLSFDSLVIMCVCFFLFVVNNTPIQESCYKNINLLLFLKKYRYRWNHIHFPVFDPVISYMDDSQFDACFLFCLG